jgi:curli biogenesis system outer membrane secretion channel CsgG
VKAQEFALRWHPEDALRFTRLQQLAASLGADRVVAGWIRQFDVGGSGGGGGRDFELGGGAGGLITGAADVVYQVFDAAQGRIVYETESVGHSVGGLNLSSAARATLDDVDRRGAAQLLGPLAGSAP